MSADATRVIVVGDGPGGLSAALFLAKNGLDAVVYGQDATAMHYALLHNYLGAPDTGGTEFQAVARRQVSDQGAEVAGAGVVVDREQRTSVDRCYAVGRSARPNRSQAIISAGAGAVAAVDILSREAGTDVTDWDSPPKD